MGLAPALRRRAYTKAPATRQDKYKEFFMSLIRLNEMLERRRAALFVLAEPVRQQRVKRIDHGSGIFAARFDRDGGAR